MTTSLDPMRTCAVWVGAALLVICACARDDIGIEEAEIARPNVILVLIDTLRADRTSLLGYGRPTTPFLERLGAESVVFSRARSQAACTFPSVNSLLTSQWPSRFHRSEDQFLGIPARLTSMPELFRAAGYHTAAVSASPIVRRNASSNNPEGGFDAGFEIFDEICLWREAECVNQRARAILEDSPEPVFLYLHYMDPHSDYAPPAGHVSRFVRPYAGHDFIAAGNPNPIAETLYADGPEIAVTDDDLNHLRDLYDEEIRYLDGQLEQLYEWLRASGTLDRSVVVVTSDHGEEFLEHGHVGHCRGIWNTLTWVPLLLRGPGLPSGVRISPPVQLVDLLPTLLELTGVESTDLQPVGTSLVPLITGQDRAVETRYAFSNQGRFRGVDDGRFHLILDGVTADAWLYDADSDPGEARNLFDRHHPRGARLAEQLGDWLGRTGQWSILDRAQAEISHEEELLKSLGYLQ